MRVRGEVFSGAMRGTPLIEKYHPRLVGLIGFRPFKGTLDIKLERSIDIRPFSSKTMEHVLLTGKHIVNAYLAPVRIRKFSKLYKLMEIRTKEEEIIGKAKALAEDAEEKFSISSAEISEPFHECWAVQFTAGVSGFKGGLYGHDVVELVADCMLKEKLTLDDGDFIEIEFSEKKGMQSKLPEPEGVKAGSDANAK